MLAIHLIHGYDDRKSTGSVDMYENSVFEQQGSWKPCLSVFPLNPRSLDFIIV